MPGHKMEKLLILIVMFGICCAVRQDLTGKVFIFPKETDSDYVKLLTIKTKLSFVTTCLRFQTDLTRNYGLFSMSTPSARNAFALFKLSEEDVIRFHAQGSGSDFRSLSFPPNAWHSICATWRSDNGLAQLWLDGKATIKRFIKIGAITGVPISILGHKQDSQDRRFDASQSFVGMITDVHMWDSVLTAANIKRYMDKKYITPGNVFNWQNLEYEIRGQIMVENESEVM